jgi:hypothetical protein
MPSSPSSPAHNIDIIPYPCLALPCPHLSSSSVTMSQIRSCLQSQQSFQIKKQQFETLLSLLPLESKTIEFYSALLPSIFSHSTFSSETLDLLLSHQSDLLTFQDHSGNTFFHYLILHSLPLPMVQSLIEYNTQLIKLTNFCGETCLHLALQATPQINFDLVKLLLFHNPDAVNLPSNSGKLPIHHLFKPASASGSSPDLTTPRDSCLELLLKLNPLNAYSAITEKITRINIQPLSSPASVMETPDLPVPAPLTPPPLISLIERRWSPHSEATRAMNEENSGKVLKHSCPSLPSLLP